AVTSAHGGYRERGWPAWDDLAGQHRSTVAGRHRDVVPEGPQTQGVADRVVIAVRQERDRVHQVLRAGTGTDRRIEPDNWIAGEGDGPEHRLVERCVLGHQLRLGD